MKETASEFESLKHNSLQFAQKEKYITSIFWYVHILLWAAGAHRRKRKWTQRSFHYCRGGYMVGSGTTKPLGGIYSCFLYALIIAFSNFLESYIKPKRRENKISKYFTNQLSFFLLYLFKIIHNNSISRFKPWIIGTNLTQSSSTSCLTP